MLRFHECISEIFAMFLYVTIICFGPYFPWILTYQILFNSRYYWIMLAYILWIICDKNCDGGNRRINFNFGIYKHIENYFPVTLHKATDFTLDPNRNYLFCSVPHGVVTNGLISAFVRMKLFKELFPNHEAHLATLKWLFYPPFFRELLIFSGCISSSFERISEKLSASDGGECVGLSIGGAAEVQHSKPRQYKLTIKSRRGFVRLALKCGSPLIPCLSFGEVDVYDQIQNQFILKFQLWVKNKLGVYPVIPIGRWYTVIPMKKPIFVVG